jgi:single-stranded DNA-binding protein
MGLSVNRVLLVGTIGKYGTALRYAPSGSACTSFLLCVTEQGHDQQYFSTLVPCEVWGKKAEAASEVAPGTLALFEGKISRRKKGDGWELVVSGFELTLVLPPTPALSGHTN